MTGSPAGRDGRRCGAHPAVRGPWPQDRRASGPVLALAALLLLPAAAAAQQAASSVRPAVAQPSAAPAHRWQVEVTGAQASLDPSDLNALVSFETAILDHLRTQPVQQTHEGGLRTLGRALPLGARVMRQVGRRVSVGAGFSWFDVARRSSAGASYAFTEVDPKAQYFERAFSETIDTGPVEVATREFFAHAAVRYDWITRGRIRLGTAIHAGWVAVECRAERARTIDGGYYPRRRESGVSMEGHGNGPAGDALVTARVAVTGRLGVLAEAGYAWHEIRTITGTSESTMVTQDGEAAEIELSQTSRSEGRWVNQPVANQTGVGVWYGTTPAVGGVGSPFTLGLSGWRFALGVSLGL